MMGFFKKIFKEKEPVEEVQEYRQYMIVCPHCFRKFAPDDVVFRLTHHTDDEKYCLQEDLLLNDYLEKFGLEASDELEAVITPNDVPEASRIYADGVLIGLRDKYGVETRKRLCPFCHNDLPFLAGKTPSNIIAIIGDSQVGKSVYMSALIRTLEAQTAHEFNAACLPSNNETSIRFNKQYINPLFYNNTLIESTQKERKQEPFIYDFKFKDQSKTPLSLVFFDVAGEGMTDNRYLELYANHIKNATGILFLVDPLEFPILKDKIVKRYKDLKNVDGMIREPRDVIVSLSENFISAESGERTNIPTAIVLTKSDMLLELDEAEIESINVDSRIFSNYIHKGYFDLGEYRRVEKEVVDLFNEVSQSFIDAVEVHFSNTGFFAVSALGQNPVEGKLEGVIQPTRVDEPFLWLLYKLGYISGGES